jgi:hypothetical protein
VGGDEHVQVLLKPLELLVCGEESSIRNQALASVDIIIQRMNTEQISQYLLPLIKSLAVKDW